MLHENASLIFEENSELLLIYEQILQQNKDTLPTYEQILQQDKDILPTYEQALKFKQEVNAFGYFNDERNPINLQQQNIYIFLKNERDKNYQNKYYLLF